MPLRTRILDERGMTLVEVMIAMVILLVGVLGTLTLVQGSMSSTSRTTAREQATNLARDLVERSRQVGYEDLASTSAAATLAGTLSDATAPSGLTFDVDRRNATYNVRVTACSIDDPTDGAGAGNATFCADPQDPDDPVNPPPLPSLNVRVLGIDVALGGSLLDTVCDSLGISTSEGTILHRLTSAVSPVAPISLCPDDPSGGTRVKYDSDPDDMRRIRVQVSWDRGGAASVSQTTLLTNPVQS